MKCLRLVEHNKKELWYTLIGGAFYGKMYLI